jgi:hypothetical protein
MSVEDGAAELFERARRQRRVGFSELSAGLSLAAAAHAEVVERLRRDGFAHLPRFLPAVEAAAALRRVDELCRTGEHLQPPARVAGLADDADYREATRLDAAELARGVDRVRHLTSAVNVADPLLTVPGLVDVAFDERLLAIAGAYLGCPPLLGFVKLTRSLANELRPFDTEEFHVDGNSTTLLKAFVHLHDTDAECGPHQFVRGSHRDRIDGWDVSARASEEEILARYGRDRLVTHGARAGDVVVEDTSGFHRRLKARSRDRTILILNYVVHEEYGGGGARARIRASDLARAGARARSAAELLEVVEEQA